MAKSEPAISDRSGDKKLVKYSLYDGSLPNRKAGLTTAGRENGDEFKDTSYLVVEEQIWKSVRRRECSNSNVSKLEMKKSLKSFGKDFDQSPCHI
jgi:hypothetical protein